MNNEVLKKMDEVYDRNSSVLKFAVRKTYNELAEGQELPKSFDESDNGDGEELSGTSGTLINYSRYAESSENLEAIEEAAKANSGYCGKHQYIIAGYDEGYGQDENEIILSHAFIICEI